MRKKVTIARVHARLMALYAEALAHDGYCRPNSDRKHSECGGSVMGTVICRSHVVTKVPSDGRGYKYKWDLPLSNPPSKVTAQQIYDAYRKYVEAQRDRATAKQAARANPTPAAKPVSGEEKRSAALNELLTRLDRIENSVNKLVTKWG